jgi:hypothetical protein
LDELDGYAAIKERIQREYRNHPDFPYWLLALSCGRRKTEAKIAWCDEAREVLQNLAAPSVVNGNKGKRRKTELVEQGRDS